MSVEMVASSPGRNKLGPLVCAVGKGMWGKPAECSEFELLDGRSCDIGALLLAPKMLVSLMLWPRSQHDWVPSACVGSPSFYQDVLVGYLPGHNAFVR
ncbi:hypothetical protein B296_00001079 [Ensete ventricosum]|uniref:Uncharacterized protein n=1 Tax=Ensete ventricosum TaxID=4639 RepID=A0A427AVY4_ENSVE|nr:hypothetical protein B296_00001079 [Ensete ventricosum]